MSRPRSGFTLIELLIVVVIIGILAAIAIPKFRSVREKSYIAAIKSDLRNFASAQERYFQDNNTYAANVAATTHNGTTGVVITVNTAVGTGWGATATHPGAATWTCEMVYGTGVTPVLAGTTEGIIHCE